MGDEVKAVEFVAEIRQVKTMADHTVNVTLNLPEYCIDQVSELLKHHGWQVQGVIEFVNQDRSQNVTEQERTETNY